MLSLRGLFHVRVSVDFRALTCAILPREELLENVLPTKRPCRRTSVSAPRYAQALDSRLENTRSRFKRFPAKTTPDEVRAKIG